MKSSCPAPRAPVPFERRNRCLAVAGSLACRPGIGGLRRDRLKCMKRFCSSLAHPGRIIEECVSQERNGAKVADLAKSERGVLTQPGIRVVS